MSRVTLALLAVLLLPGAISTRPESILPAGILAGVVTDGTSPVADAVVMVVGRGGRARTDARGAWRITGISAGTHTIEVTHPGHASQRRAATVRDGETTTVRIVLRPVALPPEAVVGRDAHVAREQAAAVTSPAVSGAGLMPRDEVARRQRAPAWNTEEYAFINENRFHEARLTPVSTFAIDVDRASYANVRRFLTQGQRPPADAVRIEELVNYFTYDYAEPRGRHPFTVQADIAPAPWQPRHRLVRIGLRGRSLDAERRPASNLVFLIDVSGSMQSADKLPLVKRALGVLVDALGPDDRVAIVVYAGQAGLVLPATPGTQRAAIRAAIERLEAGGSTAGGAGIRLAYQVAREQFVAGGNNRVILATDGDFNVGMSSEGELVRLVTSEGKGGIHLTVLGFGTGNYKDARMESLADHGDGNYAYIDTAREAVKVFGHELTGTLFTIAKDVKIQVEFNPARVRSYRLIGYENRLLAREDFDDDQKDAGELGAGHTVTALYEVVPATGHDDTDDGLRYQRRGVPSDDLTHEWLTVKLRYQPPEGGASALMTTRVTDADARRGVSGDFSFAAAVAGFGMLLRESEHAGTLTWQSVRALAERGIGRDPHGERAEFLRLVDAGKALAPPRVSLVPDGVDGREPGGAEGGIHPEDEAGQE